MDLSRELKELGTGPRDLRKFGFTVGGVFALLACWFYFRHKAAWVWPLWPAVPLLSLGLIAPGLLRWPYLAWMSFAFLLGFIVSTVLLTLFYYLVITPIGFIARFAGKDFLTMRPASARASYWISRSAAERASKYDQQF
jgi:hypothetical protein